MSANTITYEVQVREGGRWVTQGHYERGDREEAIAHAKSVERLKNQMVKVVRETFTAESNQAEQVVVYRSEPQAVAAPPPGQRKEAPKEAKKPAGEKEAPKGAPAAKKPAAKKAPDPAPLPSALTGMPVKRGLSSSLRTFGKGVGIVLFAMLAGLAVMSALAKVIDLFDSPTLSLNKTPILLVSYITAVLMTALPLLLRVFGPPRRKAKPAESVLPDPEPVPVLEDRPVLAPPPEAAPVAPSASDLADAFLADAALAEAAAADMLAALDDGEVLVAPDEEPAPEETLPEETLPPLTPDQQFAELRAAVATALLQGASEADPHGAIGAGLLLAGGADRLRVQEGEAGGRFAAVLAEGLDSLGAGAGFSQTFLDELETSVSRPHYRNMLAAGYLLIDDIAEQRRGDAGRARRYLDAWMTPVETMPAGEEQAVILVSSLHPRDIAAFHDGRGDILAELHGEMIRRSLILYSGTLVSLSPEQAVVRFHWSGQAIEAAIAIQEAARMRNREAEHDRFDLAIGLDGGTVQAGLPQAAAPLIAAAAAAAQAAQPTEIRCTRGIFDQTPPDVFTLTPVAAGNSQAAPFKVSWQ